MLGFYLFSIASFPKVTFPELEHSPLCIMGILVPHLRTHYTSGDFSSPIYITLENDITQDLKGGGFDITLFVVDGIILRKCVHKTRTITTLYNEFPGASSYHTGELIVRGVTFQVPRTRL